MLGEVLEVSRTIAWICSEEKCGIADESLSSLRGLSGVSSGANSLLQMSLHRIGVVIVLPGSAQTITWVALDEPLNTFGVLRSGAAARNSLCFVAAYLGCHTRKLMCTRRGQWSQPYA